MADPAESLARETMLGAVLREEGENTQLGEAEKEVESPSASPACKGNIRENCRCILETERYKLNSISRQVNLN